MVTNTNPIKVISKCNIQRFKIRKPKHKKRKLKEARVMAQSLRTLAILAEDVGLVNRIHTVAVKLR